MNLRSLVAILMTGAVACSVAGAQSTESETGKEPQPRDIGLTEETERHLAQIDLTLTGDPETIANLTESDFELIVNTVFVEDFVLDSTCSPTATRTVLRPEGEQAGQATEPGPESSPPESSGRAPISYLFYFDQQHLTMEGRLRSLELARSLIPDLIRAGSRATVVSSSERLTVYAERSSSRRELLEALDRVEADKAQWDSFATLEVDRILEVLEGFDFSESYALRRATIHQKEERWRTERALRTFSMVLARMADLQPPKAVVYFADTMRSNAGEHYMYLFRWPGMNARSDSLKHNLKQGVWRHMTTDSFTAHNPYDRVIEQAAAHGVRLYTIEAQGLTTPASRIVPAQGGWSVGSHPSPPTKRLGEAQDSLVGLAMETGGRAFIHGTPAKKIARSIREDLACPHVISFSSAGFPRDQALRVLLRVKRSGVTAHTRGLTVIQSPGAQRTSRLLAAFNSPRESTSEIAGILIPDGWSDGRYTALVQIAIPGSPLPGASWEIGTSLVSNGRVQEDASGRISVDRAGVPVIFEAPMSFAPGPYEIVVVAQEDSTGQILSGNIAGEWPVPGEGEIVLGPIAVLQPADGAFVRSGKLRRRGSLARSGEQPVVTDQPTALVSIVCGRREGQPLTVRRRLTGATSVDFEPMLLDPGKKSCTQIRDLIPAESMTAGGFSYEILAEDQRESATRTRHFVAIGREELAP